MALPPASPSHPLGCQVWSLEQPDIEREDGLLGVGVGVGGGGWGGTFGLGSPCSAVSFLSMPGALEHHGGHFANRTRSTRRHAFLQKAFPDPQVPLRSPARHPPASGLCWR